VLLPYHRGRCNSLNSPSQIWYRYRTGSNTSSNWSVGVNVFEWPSPTAPLPLHTPDGITHIVAANVSDLRRVLAAKHGYSAEEAADELVHVFKCSLNEETRQLVRFFFFYI